MNRTRQWAWLCVLGALAGALAACTSNDAPARAPADAIPPSVSLEEADVVVGVATGTLRQKTHVAALRIARTPITVGQYHRCVDAGVCSKTAALANTSDLPAESVQPITSLDEAHHYCAWVGGDLPRVAEWMYAARGAAPHRFPWGDASGTCKHTGRLSVAIDTQAACCGAACADALKTGAHPDGNSPGGVSDVLAFPRELVARGSDGPASMCGADACVMSGFFPGAIDLVMPSSAQDFSFRCVWRDSK
jgi:hypothetical protein